MTVLAIALIRRDGGTQPRDHISSDVSREYAEAIADGAVLPPVTVFYDGTDYWLADGYHRLEAVGEYLERAQIDADIRQGTRRDAILFSVGANADHGYQRTNADKRRAVLTLINDDDWSQWSDSEIARRCAVSQPFVGKLRPAPVTSNVISEPVRVYTDRHGNTSTMKVGAIGGKPRTNPLVAGHATDPEPRSIEDPSLTTGMPGRGSAQLRAFLRETRGGADIEAAAATAGISIDEARLHVESEAAGEYADIIEAPPSPEREARTERDESNDALILRLIDLFEDWPLLGAAEEALAAWSASDGPHLPPERVETASLWLSEFAIHFPNIEGRRRERVEAMLERIDADVA